MKRLAAAVGLVLLALTFAACNNEAPAPEPLAVPTKQKLAGTTAPHLPDQGDATPIPSTAGPSVSQVTFDRSGSAQHPIVTMLDPGTNGDKARKYEFNGDVAWAEASFDLTTRCNWDPTPQNERLFWDFDATSSVAIDSTKLTLVTLGKKTVGSDEIWFVTYADQDGAGHEKTIDFSVETGSTIARRLANVIVDSSRHAAASSLKSSDMKTFEFVYMLPDGSDIPDGSVPPPASGVSGPIEGTGTISH